jgi:hypothetical protein
MAGSQPQSTVFLGDKEIRTAVLRLTTQAGPLGMICVFLRVANTRCSQAKTSGPRIEACGKRFFAAIAALAAATSGTKITTARSLTAREQQT